MKLPNIIQKYMIKLYEYLGKPDLNRLQVEFYTPEFIKQKLKSQGSFRIWGGFGLGEDKNRELWIVDSNLKWKKPILSVNLTYPPSIRESEMILWFPTLEEATEFSERFKERVAGYYDREHLGLNIMKSEHSYDLAILR